MFTWTGLECWRYRRSSRAEDNSPTIIVSVRKDAVRRRYFTDTQQIKGILAENGDADVSILFMENESILHDAPIVPLDVCKDVVRPGVSLGLDESEAGTGTVGGLIELKFSGDKSWRLFGLSCFHVVYRPVEDNKTKAVPGARKGPPPSSGCIEYTKYGRRALARWGWMPINFNDCLAKRLLKLNQPSEQDLLEAVNSRNQMMVTIRREVPADRIPSGTKKPRLRQCI